MRALLLCLLAACASTRTGRHTPEQVPQDSGAAGHSQSSEVGEKQEIPFEGEAERLDGSKLTAKLNANPVNIGKLNGVELQLVDADPNMQVVEWTACPLDGDKSLCVEGVLCSASQEHFALPPGDLRLTYKACRHPDFATGRRCGAERETVVRSMDNPPEAKQLLQKIEGLSQQIKGKSENTRRNIVEYKRKRTESTDDKQKSFDNMLLNQLGYNPCALGQVYSDPVYDEIKEETEAAKAETAQDPGLRLARNEAAEDAGRVLMAIGAIGAVLVAGGFAFKVESKGSLGEWKSWKTAAKDGWKVQKVKEVTKGWLHRGVDTTQKGFVAAEEFLEGPRRPSVGTQIAEGVDDLATKAARVNSRTYAKALGVAGLVFAVGLITHLVGKYGLAEKTPQQKVSEQLGTVQKEIEALRAQREELALQLLPFADAK